jgi:hypothetical protein
MKRIILFFTAILLINSFVLAEDIDIDLLKERLMKVMH